MATQSSVRRRSRPRAVAPRLAAMSSKRDRERTTAAARCMHTSEIFVAMVVPALSGPRASDTASARPASRVQVRPSLVKIRSAGARVPNTASAASAADRALS